MGEKNAGTVAMHAANNRFNQRRASKKRAKLLQEAEERAVQADRELQARLKREFYERNTRTRQIAFISPRQSSPASMLSSMLGPSLDRSHLSADMECSHGRLPADSSPECGCWKQAA